MIKCLYDFMRGSQGKFGKYLSKKEKGLKQILYKKKTLLFFNTHKRL